MQPHRALMAACAAVLVLGPRPESAPPVPVRVSTVAYADGIVLDHHIPVAALDGAPVVVLIHGCCGDRRDMAGLARALTRRGAVVMNADVRNVQSGGGWPLSYEDVVCAVSAGRAAADALPGVRHPVALVGWSDGALLAAAVTLGWDELADGVSSCAAPVSSAGPDVLVGMGGYYGWEGPGPPADIVTAATIRWFGAPPSVDPRAWQRGNPRWWLSSGAIADVPPVHLIAGAVDGESPAFWRDLVSAGVPSTIVTVDGTPLELIQPRDEVGARALGALCEVLGLPGAPL